MSGINKSCLLAIMVFASPAIAAVMPEYATNTYTEHSLSRSEKKCIDEGYKITYANCSNQTAPADRCPYHDSYYRSCSQEQWCRNNNYTFLAQDCELPTYPTKICDNKYPMYRACIEDTAKACEQAGYTSKDKCKLTDVRCPYSSDYGKCCNDCPGFAHALDNIPAGYVADGPTCTTCDGVVKTNVIEASCDDYEDCVFGPLSPQTPSCLKGQKTLYTACKTSEMVCKEKGYLYSSCQPTEDSADCPEDSNFKKCTVNCYKLALELFPQSNIIKENVTDPTFDLAKTSIRSLYGQISNTCISEQRPEVTLNITEDSLAVYSGIFTQDISNVNFILNFETPTSLPIGGNLNNVRITVKGNTPECVFKGKSFNVDGTVSLVDVTNICSDINIASSAKFITTGNITGNVIVGKDASLGVKGNLIGSLKSSSYAEIFIKGILKYKDLSKDSIDSESIVFGCNSRSKIIGGIIADTSNIIIKQRSILDTPYIKLISTSNNPDLPSSLSSIHLHRYSRIISVLGNTEYPMVENGDLNCDDKRLIHLGSEIAAEESNISLEPSNLLEDQWKCVPATRKQQECN